MCSVDAVCGRLDVNVALNRPTFMSSVHHDPQFGDYSSWKANDGNTDPMAYKMDNSCAHTAGGVGNNHWWAVDLGVPLFVTGVLYFSRADGAGNIHEYRVVNLEDFVRDREWTSATACPGFFTGEPPPSSVWPHLFCEKRRGEQLKWSLAFRLYIGSFPCAQLTGSIHTARLGRVFYI